MKIAVEGLDGSGKSSIAKYIRDKYNFEYKRDYLENMLDLSERKFFSLKDKINNYIEVRTLLFMSPLIYAFQSSNKNTVFDRFILSEYYYDGSEESKEWFEIFVKKNYLPDLTFILYASDEIRKERIYERNKNDSDLSKINNGKELYNKMLFFADKYNMNYIFINTNNLDLNEVENIIDKCMFEFINNYKGEECQEIKRLKYLKNMKK